MNTKSTNIVAIAAPSYRNSAKRPIRFDHLHGGSTFKIVSEPSRGIKEANDNRIYRKDRDGFFAVDTATGAGAVLFPYDLVMPVVRDKGVNAKSRPASNVVPFPNKQQAAV